MQAAVPYAQFGGHVGERGVTDIRVGQRLRTAHTRDMPMAEVIQILHRLTHSVGVGAGQARQVAGHGSVGNRKDRHIRVLLKQEDARVAKLHVDQQQSIDVAGGDPILDDRQFGILAYRHANQNRIIMLFQLGPQAGDQLHHERFDGQQLGIVIQHQADALRLRLGQRLGRAVRLPAQFMGHLQHLGTGSLGDSGFAVEGIRDGAAGNA